MYVKGQGGKVESFRPRQYQLVQPSWRMDRKRVSHLGYQNVGP